MTGGRKDRGPGSVALSPGVVHEQSIRDILSGAGARELRRLAGLDLRVGSGRLTFVPSFRVQAARTGTATDSEYPGGGFPLWTFRPGVTIRFAF
jgi:hypothetical protein